MLRGEQIGLFFCFYTHQFGSMGRVSPELTEYYLETVFLLSNRRRSVASHLRADAPLFTKALADGLAFAEDPGGVRALACTDAQPWPGA